MTRKKAVIMMVCAALFWSIAGVFFTMNTWHPLVIAGVRSGIAGTFMLFFAPPFPKKINRLTWLGAVFYLLVAGLFVMANKLTTTTNAIVLQFTAPIWLMLMMVVGMKMKIKARDVAVVIAVMAGIVLFFIEDLSFGSVLGNLLAILAGVMLAAMILVMKRDKDTAPIHMTILGSYMLMILCLPALFLTPVDLTFVNIVSILILGVFQLGLGYVLFTKSVHHVTELDAALLPVIEPLFSPVWVVVIAGITPGPLALLGGAIVIAAIVIKQGLDAKDHVRNTYKRIA